MGFKILLRAGPGELASCLEGVFEEQPFNLLLPLDLNWDDKVAVRGFLQANPPSIFINYAPGQFCQTELERIRFVTELCRKDDIPFVHFSSYRVFGKTVHEAKLAEDAAPKPRDDIAKQLLKIEQTVGQNQKHLLLRVSWVLGGETDNLLDTLVPKLLVGDRVFVSDHNFGRPVNIAFLGNVILALVQQILCGAQNWGVFHVHSSDRCSEAEFSDALVRLMRIHSSVDIDMPLVAGADDDRRLLQGNAWLVGDRCTRDFGIQWQSWRMGLKSLVSAYLTAKGHPAD